MASANMTVHMAVAPQTTWNMVKAATNPWFERDARYLYMIERVGGLHYDEVESVVVCARDSKVARKLAGTACGSEGYEVWQSPRTKLTKLGLARKPNGKSPARERVVIVSFNAG